MVVSFQFACDSGDDRMEERLVSAFVMGDNGGQI